MCHQAVSLTANVLEAAGITTVVVGSARDIVEEAGVPRFVFTDLPLGNPYGEPGDTATQAQVLDLALTTAESAIAPRTTIGAPTRWSGPEDWRATYMHVGDDNRADLLAAGNERRAEQADARAARSTNG